jgi:hypothetical protein
MRGRSICLPILVHRVYPQCCSMKEGLLYMVAPQIDAMEGGQDWQKYASAERSDSRINFSETKLGTRA